jgi:hypothetical protein
LGYLISTAISRSITAHQSSTSNTSQYIHDFARYIVKIASKRAVLAKDTDNAIEAKNYDPVSIISLNWDILLDNALYRSLEEDCDKKGDYDPFGVVDYCCYISSVERGDCRIRSGLWSLGCRGYNVKLLKIHGSMNWLQCPNCQRLFVKFGNAGSKQNILQMVRSAKCRHCTRFGHNCRLSDSLVMPTFLKDLSNFQIKLVWQNTGVELMEAKHLIFMGYSLPHADFEFRQLLSRMVHRDATVDVVLFEGTSDEQRKRYSAEKERYKPIFWIAECALPSRRCNQLCTGADRSGRPITKIRNDAKGTIVMLADQVLESFVGLHTWKRKGERAPHKPLLVLLALGRLQRGEARMVSFSSIEEALSNLLKEFGSPRRSVHPEYPFWRLQRDSIWEVRAAVDLKRRRSNSDPLKSELRYRAVEGGITEGLSQTLKEHPEIVRLHDSIASAVGLDLDGITRSRERDPNFRREIISVWGHRCGFCGFDVKLDRMVQGLLRHSNVSTTLGLYAHRVNSSMMAAQDAVMRAIRSGTETVQ